MVIFITKKITSNIDWRKKYRRWRNFKDTTTVIINPIDYRFDNNNNVFRYDDPRFDVHPKLIKNNSGVFSSAEMDYHDKSNTKNLV